MTANEIDSLAKKGEPLPEGSMLSAYMLWYSLRALYREYKAGITDKGTAQKVKRDMQEQYADQSRWERIYLEDTRRMNEVSRLMVKAHKEGCPICKQMSDIFSGIRREVM